MEKYLNSLKYFIISFILSGWIIFADIYITKKIIFTFIVLIIIYNSLNISEHSNLRRKAIYFILLMGIYIMFMCNLKENSQLLLTLFLSNWQFSLCALLISVLLIVRRWIEKHFFLDIIIILSLILGFRYIPGINVTLEYMGKEYGYIAFLYIICRLLFFVFIPMLYLKRMKEDFNISFKLNSFAISFICLFIIISIYKLIFHIGNSVYLLKENELISIIHKFLIQLTGIALPEEILYRGCLCRTLINYIKSKELSILIMSMIFGAMHLRFGIVFSFFTVLTSVIFAYLLRKTNSYVYPVFVHATINTII